MRIMYNLDILPGLNRVNIDFIKKKDYASWPFDSEFGQLEGVIIALCNQKGAALNLSVGTLWAEDPIQMKELLKLANCLNRDIYKDSLGCYWLPTIDEPLNNNSDYTIVTQEEIWR